MKKKRLDDFPHRGRWSQILLRMKLKFVLVFCMLVQTFAAVNAQTVTLKKQNASLEEIIWELKEQTKFVFLYSSADIATVKGIDIDMQNSQIDAILKKCLEGTDLQFVKENNAIIIRQAFIRQWLIKLLPGLPRAVKLRERSSMKMAIRYPELLY